jgi:hypothetical protein
MKRTLTSDEIINEIAETLREGDGEFIESIANQVLVPTVTYAGDSMFEQDTDGEIQNMKTIILEVTTQFTMNIDEDINVSDVMPDLNYSWDSSNMDDGYDVIKTREVDYKIINSIDNKVKTADELRADELRSEIAHLESILPEITDRHEYSGTVEVIGRLESKLEALEGASHGN